MPAMLSVVTMLAVFTVVPVLTVRATMPMATMLAVMTAFIVMAMFAMAFPLRDNAGTGIFLAPLTARGAQIAMPAAAGTYIRYFFHVY